MRHDDRSSARRHRDPFTWRLAELDARRGTPGQETRVAQLAGDLLVAEANEAARGLRHVSIAHGAPATPMAAAQVETFVGNVDRLVPPGWWSRRGDGSRLIVMVGGDGADEHIRQLAAVAELCNPGHWHVALDARAGLTTRV